MNFFHHDEQEHEDQEKEQEEEQEPRHESREVHHSVHHGGSGGGGQEAQGRQSASAGLERLRSPTGSLVGGRGIAWVKHHSRSSSALDLHSLPEHAPNSVERRPSFGAERRRRAAKFVRNHAPRRKHKEKRCCFPNSKRLDRVFAACTTRRLHLQGVAKHGPDLLSGVYTQLISLVSAAPVSEPLTPYGRIVNLGLGFFILIFVVVFTGATANSLVEGTKQSALKSVSTAIQKGVKVRAPFWIAVDTDAAFCSACRQSPSAPHRSAHALSLRLPCASRGVGVKVSLCPHALDARRRRPPSICAHTECVHAHLCT